MVKPGYYYINVVRTRNLREIADYYGVSFKVVLAEALDEYIADRKRGIRMLEEEN